MQVKFSIHLIRAESSLLLKTKSCQTEEWRDRKTLHLIVSSSCGCFDHTVRILLAFNQLYIQTKLNLQGAQWKTHRSPFQWVLTSSCNAFWEPWPNWITFGLVCQDLLDGHYRLKSWDTPADSPCDPHLFFSPGSPKHDSVISRVNDTPSTVLIALYTFYFL